MNSRESEALDQLKLDLQALRVALANKASLTKICRLAFAVGAAKDRLEAAHAKRSSA